MTQPNLTEKDSKIYPGFETKKVPGILILSSRIDNDSIEAVFSKPVDYGNACTLMSDLYNSKTGGNCYVERSGNIYGFIVSDGKKTAYFVDSLRTSHDSALVDAVLTPLNLFRKQSERHRFKLEKGSRDFLRYFLI